jgi:hypothetical protein
MSVLLHFCTTFPADAQVSDNLCYKLSNDLDVFGIKRTAWASTKEGRGSNGLPQLNFFKRGTDMTGPR